MKRILTTLLLISVLLLCGCANSKSNAQVIATTRPVYDFTLQLCKGTDIEVQLLVTEQLSCLHDYSLQVRQMRALESAQAVVISGAGLEEFLGDALAHTEYIIDSSKNIPVHELCHYHHHDQNSHEHEQDPHIWLKIDNARIMASNICQGLIQKFPEQEKIFYSNLEELNKKFDTLAEHGNKQLSELDCRKLITFHDGFSYFAQEWNLEILRAVEEESGSEASAHELKELIHLTRTHCLPAIFVEESGSTSAAQIIARETGVKVYSLNMGMSEKDYFESMYQNIDNIKEALG